MEKIYFEMSEGERILSKLENDIDYALTVLSEGVLADYHDMTIENVNKFQNKASDLLIEANQYINKLLKAVKEKE